MSLDKLSAYATVTQKFLALCVEVRLSPEEAWSAIGRLGGFGSGKNVNSPSEEFASPSLVKTLTKEEKKEAKNLAKKAKAKRMGLSPSEINLTPTEVQEAIRNFKSSSKNELKVEKSGGSQASKPSVSKESKAEKKIGTKESAVAETSVGQHPEINPSGPSGTRTSQKIKMDNLRRLAQRAVPSVITDPTVLHLIAYSNARRRLALTWDRYRSQYTVNDNQNPMKGLPDIADLENSQELLDREIKSLKSNTEFPGIYLLCDDQSTSYFDRDKPNESVCPKSLLLPLSSDVLSEFEEAIRIEDANEA